MNSFQKGLRKIRHELKHWMKELEYLSSATPAEKWEFFRYVVLHSLSKLAIQWSKKAKPPNSLFLLDDLLSFAPSFLSGARNNNISLLCDYDEVVCE